MFKSVLTAALCLAVGDSAALRPSFLNPTRAPLQALAAPSIQITSMPAWGENGSISGVVRGTSPATCAVAVYIHVEGAYGIVRVFGGYGVWPIA